MRKRLALLPILLTSQLIIAAEQNQTWSCEGTAASGLNWEDGRWLTAEFSTRIYRLTFQDSKLLISENNDPVLFEMNCNDNTWSMSCANAAASFELSRENSTAILTRFFGSIFPEPAADTKDAVYIEILACQQINISG